MTEVGFTNLNIMNAAYLVEATATDADSMPSTPV